MRFADIAGNQKDVQALRGMADNGRVAHAMLFYENDGCGALPLALAYLQYLNCEHPVNGDSCGTCPSCRQMSKLIHPDVHFVFPVNTGTKSSSSERASSITSEYYLKEWRELVLANPYFLENDLMEAIGIEKKTGNILMSEAKAIVSQMSLTAVGNGYKTVLMYLPEKMNVAAANKLLKLVEEPPEKTIFIFITHAPEKVLQTIFSRCQSLRVLPLGRPEVAQVLVSRFDVDPEEAERLALSSEGSVGQALSRKQRQEDYTADLDLFKDLMDALVGRNLLGALECADLMAALPSREKQKAFCVFMEEALRNIFMYQQGMQAVVAVPEAEREFYESMAARCRKSFCHKAIMNIDKTVELIDRNVNARILFTDLVDRLFLTI